MNWIMENYRLIILVVCMLIVVADAVVVFIRQPRKQQIETLKEWLKYAVSVAEQELGSGTGKLKLRYVYDMFIGTFPALSKILSFDKFSELVDEALVWMEAQIDTNNMISALLSGEEEEKIE